MEQEINAGYVITDRIIVGDAVFVIGECEKRPARYVTWKCKKGEKEYYWGHYMGNRLTALEDLCNRALDEIRMLKDFQQEQTNGEKRGSQVQKEKHEQER